jgi:hypothetical protein
MLKALLLIAAVFSSCAGSPVTKPPVYVEFETVDEPAVQGDSGAAGPEYKSGPGEGRLVVTGVSGRMRDAEGELDAALDDAAWQVALYHGLKGKAVTILETGAGYRDFYLVSESELEPLDAGGYAKYREALRYDREKDVVRTDKAVFVRCVYDAPGLQPVERVYGTGNGEPAWLHGGCIEMPGYISAVGFARNRRYLNETIARSRENAAAALMVKVSSRIETIVAGRADRGAAEATTEIVEGELFNFMVLEIWIEPETGSVWTLAAARNRVVRQPEPGRVQ